MSFHRLEKQHALNVMKFWRNSFKSILLVVAGILLGDTWAHSFGIMFVLYIMMPIDWPETLG